MSKMTLLEMVQNILSATDDDEVNSIGDTISSMQVAEVIKETYDEMFGNISIPSRMGMIQLEGLADTTRPNYMKLPDNVKSIEWLKYNTPNDGVTDYQDVTYCEPEEFFKKQMSSYTTPTQSVQDFNGVYITVRTDRAPEFWTTFDNQHVVFDSFDNSVDSTLQQSKTACWGEFFDGWQMEDDYIPNLDANLFPLLLAESKSSAFINQKGVSNSKSEQQSKRQRIRMQNDRWRLNQRDYRGQDYSRKR